MTAAEALVIDDDTMASVVAYLRKDSTRERGGFLLGRLATDARPVTRIDEAIPCPDAPSSPCSLTFRADEWQLVHTHPAVASGESEIVGWFHSHPDMPVAMSSRDRFIQQHFFSHPGQIAWIIDPVGGAQAFWCMRSHDQVMSIRRARPAEFTESDDHIESPRNG